MANRCKFVVNLEVGDKFYNPETAYDYNCATWKLTGENTPYEVESIEIIENVCHWIRVKDLVTGLKRSLRYNVYKTPFTVYTIVELVSDDTLFTAHTGKSTE